jgi:hypothetical protein
MELDLHLEIMRDYAASIFAAKEHERAHKDMISSDQPIFLVGSIWILVQTSAELADDSESSPVPVSAPLDTLTVDSVLFTVTQYQT